MHNDEVATGEHTARTKARPAVNAELLDVRAVAKLLDCSARQVYRLADDGRMPRPIKLGQPVRWRRAQDAACLDAGCQAVRSARGAAR